MIPQQQLPQQSAGAGVQNPMQNAAIFQQLMNQMGYGQTNLRTPQPQPQQPNPQQMMAAQAQRMPQSPAQPPMQQQQMPQAAQQPQKGRYTPQELAALGRMGDQTIAHLTPGEITVPPQVQTPKVLATLNKEYHKKGVDPSQFTAGSPNSSVNPSTGVQELSFWSNFLPIALGALGTVVAPGIGTALGSELGASALAGIGGGLGTTVGGLASGETPLQAIGSGALSGFGGYYGGQLLGPSTAEVSKAAGIPEAATNISGQAGLSTAQQAAQKTAMDTARQSLMNVPSLSNLYGVMPAGTNLGSAAGSIAGGQLGSAMLAPSASSSQLPDNFKEKYKSARELPSAAELLGTTSNKNAKANFNGYNPYVNNPMAYRFFG